MSDTQRQVVKASGRETVLGCINNPVFKAELQKAARTNIKAETLLRIILTQVRRNPKLELCNPQSFMAAVLTGTQLGLEFGREAHLVPFKEEVQLIPDYKGLIQLMYRSGLVECIIPENVFSNEIYRYRPAHHVPIEHQPVTPSKRGDHIASYAIAWIKGGSRPIAAWMWAEDIVATMNRSAAVKFGGQTPWKTDFFEMAKKTVVKRLSKILPASAEFAQAVSLDNQAETGEEQDLVDISFPSEEQQPTEKPKKPKKTLDNYATEPPTETTTTAAATVDLQAVVDRYMAMVPNDAANLRDKFDFKNVLELKQLPMETILEISKAIGQV